MAATVPWRINSVGWDEEAKEELKRELVEYRPTTTQDGSNINIMLFGPIVSGKSAFVNTVNSIFYGYVSGTAIAGNDVHILTSKFRKYPTRQGKGGVPLNFRLCDTMGLEAEGGISAEDFNHVLDGHIMDGYDFIDAGGIDINNPKYCQYPHPRDKMHVGALILDGACLSIHNKDIMNKLRAVKQQINFRGIPLVVVITKIDYICPDVEDDLSNVYESEGVKETVQEASRLIGIPRGHIVVVKSYESETDLDEKVDILAMVAIRQMLRFAVCKPVENLLQDISRQIGKEWRKIGINLGILLAKLDRLEGANMRNLEGAIRDMLEYWWRKERFKKEQFECLDLMKKSLITSNRRDIADYAENYQNTCRLKDNPFYDDPVAKMGIENFQDDQEISQLVVNIPATSVRPEDPMELHYYFVEFGKLVFECWQKSDTVPVTSQTFSNHEFKMQNIALAYYLSYTNDQDIENGLDALYSSCEKENVDAVLPFCCQFSMETSEKVIQSRYKNLKVKQEDDLAKVSSALRKLADSIRLDSSEVNLISCTELSTKFWCEMEMLCSPKLLNRGKRKPQDSIENVQYRPELIVINEQTKHLKQAWEKGLMEPEAALVIVGATDCLDQTSGQTPSSKEYTSVKPLEKPFIGGENIPDIKSEKTSVSWLILKQVKSSAKLFRFVEKICTNNSHPLGVTIMGWQGSYDDLQRLFVILRRNGKVMHMCIDLSGVQFLVPEWVEIFEELDLKNINSLKLIKCDLKKEVLQSLMKVIFDSEFLHGLDIQENSELFTGLQLLKQRDFEDRQLSSLEILRIGGVYVPQVDVKKPVSEFLKLTPNMKELDVKFCVCDLVPEILQLQNITHLTMSQTSSRTIAGRVNGMDFEVLFKNLGEIPKLETFIAGWCSMGDDIIKVLAKNLNQVPKLNVLTLCYNKITEVGFIPLVKSMAQHAGIVEFNVERNPLGKEGFATMLEQLDKLVNMRRIVLSKTLALNEVDRDIGKKLCCNLVKSPSIVTVELKGMGFESNMFEGFPQLRKKVIF